jgi:hypothetical protein
MFHTICIVSDCAAILNSLRTSRPAGHACSSDHNAPKSPCESVVRAMGIPKGNYKNDIPGKRQESRGASWRDCIYGRSSRYAREVSRGVTTLLIQLLTNSVVKRSMRLNSNAGDSGKISPRTHGTASGTSLKIEKQKDSLAQSIIAIGSLLTTKSKKKYLVINIAHPMERFAARIHCQKTWRYETLKRCKMVQRRVLNS